MYRAASFTSIAILALGLSGGVAVSQSQSIEELRAAGEAADAKLREEDKKRIEEQIERDRAVGRAIAAEQRRRAGLPDEPAPADIPAAEAPAAPAPAAPAAAPTTAAAPPPIKETPAAVQAPAPPAKKASPRY